MVDFRYHLVSLISVFLALAVGIVLGAGPLQDSIGNTLNAQVETLRESRENLRAQADAAQNELAQANDALAIAGESLTGDALSGTTVAIVTFPGVKNQDLQAMTDEVSAAGATISSMVTLTKNMYASEKATYRKALADNLRSYLPELPEDASAESVLGHAISYVLRYGSEDANSKVILGALAESEDKVLTVNAEALASAQAVIFVAAGGVPSESYTSMSGLYSGIAAGGATVAVGGGEGDLLATLRSEQSTSTVDSYNTVAGEINTVLATAQELAGNHVAYGFAKGASLALGARP